MEIQPWMIISVAVCILGIILLSGRSLFRNKTREQYLQDLSEHLKTKFEPYEGFENGFVTRFNFEGNEFEFVDLEDTGFRDDMTSHKALLKIQAESNLTLNFTEKGRKNIKGNIIRASDIKDGETGTIDVPKELREFEIFSNYPIKANEFFKQDKVVDVFAYLKNVDSRGHAGLPISIHNGLVTIQFYSSSTRKPSIFDLKNSTSKIHDYLDDLKILSNALKAAEEAFKV